MKRNPNRGRRPLMRSSTTANARSASCGKPN